MTYHFLFFENRSMCDPKKFYSLKKMKGGVYYGQKCHSSVELERAGARAQTTEPKFGLLRRPDWAI